MSFLRSHLFFGVSVNTPSSVLADITGISPEGKILEISYEDTPDIPDNPGTAIYNNFENSFIIYPNPVVNNLIISCVEFDSNIGIYDMYGKLLLTKKIDTNTAIIDVRYLQSGTYLIKVFSQKGVVTKKIVKQ